MTTADEPVQSIDEIEEQERINAEEKLINEEYKIWKKNTPFLYDVMITKALDWPTLTTQWFPDVETPQGKDYTLHRLLLGTHTSDNDQNFLQIATVQLPRADMAADSRKYDEDRGEVGGYGSVDSKISITQRIPHEGEINRARYMPQKPDIIATKTVSGEVHIFDRTKYPSQPNPNNMVVQPTLRLRGHTQEGYGLSWSPLKAGNLLSSADDSLICHWDIGQVTKDQTLMDPLRIYRGHSTVVGDVCWHKTHEHYFASVGDDRRLLIWDTRSSSADKPTFACDAHDAEINCVDFSPAHENQLITGSNDTTVKLWDMRNLKLELHTFTSHRGDVIACAFNPHKPYIFASASADRRVNVWDITRIGDEQTPEDAEDGPPELLFVHGGHTNKLADFAWSLDPKMPWFVASAAEDNIIQVWDMARNIYEDVVGAETDIPANQLE